MLRAYREIAGRLERLPPDAPLGDAIWIDVYRPIPEQVATVEALGVPVPSLADMEEIEMSNRLYQENGLDVMTAVLPGLSTTKEAMAGPVTFILAPGRLVTVRYHAPRPFETFPDRADKSTTGCGDPLRLFLGLVEDIVARMADLLEGVGTSLDAVAREVHVPEGNLPIDRLRAALAELGRQGELVSRVRLALLTLDRMLGFFAVTGAKRDGSKALQSAIKAHLRDIKALEVHGDFLGGRIALITDVTLGMVNLSQNATIRIVSVVAVIFLPPTLIASAYGMNFALMPELEWRYGYPMALGLMLGAAVFTYLFFKWRNWL
jgi:magnesium transporter